MPIDEENIDVERHARRQAGATAAKGTREQPQPQSWYQWKQMNAESIEKRRENILRHLDSVGFYADYATPSSSPFFSRAGGRVTSSHKDSPTGGHDHFLSRLAAAEEADDAVIKYFQ